MFGLTFGDRRKTDEVVALTGATLPQGFHFNENGAIFDDASVEYDANLDPKQHGVLYGADNKPTTIEELTGNASTVVVQPVKFTETRKSISGEDFQYQHPAIVKDGKLMVGILPFGHVPSQQLVNCQFEDGTTKHVSVEELNAAGIDYPLS